MSLMTASQKSVVPFAGLPCPKDFEVCWAGEFPPPSPKVPPLICLGSTDGKLLFANPELTKVVEGMGPGSKSREAINGVAALGKWVGVATRNEVSFWATDRPQGLYAPVGAHGIVTTASGLFLAPLGQTGILIGQPAEDDLSLFAYTPGDGYYIYRTLVLGTNAREVLVCAARRVGILCGVFHPFAPSNAMTAARFEHLDIVDACSLGSSNCLAVGALSRDGTIILFRDVLNDKQPKKFKFQGTPGVAYRMLCHHGDIYLLTSHGLYVLGGLASRFLDEGTSQFTIPILPLSVVASDINLAWDRWLLVVKGDEILRFDVDQIHQLVPATDEEPVSCIESDEPEWSEIGTETKSMALAG